MTRESDLSDLVRAAFEKERISFETIRIRSFPGEHIVVVEVAGETTAAVKLANKLDSAIEDGFVTVKQVSRSETAPKDGVKSVHDERVTKLIEILDARSRTSEAQPSLRYVSDVAGRLNVALTPRHHLIFGRRGVGKTALMLEAKKLAGGKGASCIWLNVQTLRGLGSLRAFLTVASRICDLPQRDFGVEWASRISGQHASVLRPAISKLLRGAVTPRAVHALVPQIQQMLSAFAAERDSEIYVFIDDVHYLSLEACPEFLDLLHGATRDTPTWLKVAGIRHQMRWFSAESKLGLQIGHDASEIDLDITLEQPARAKEFLVAILQGYIDECNSGPRRRFLSNSALDRLVLASGGVPRDFAILCAECIQGARRRTKARSAGVQDVNQAAGMISKSKMRELEDDAAADVGRAQAILGALTCVREFLLNTKQITFMRIDFVDKEQRPNEYALTQSLMDLRMLHLVNASVSDAHQAGRRSEVYMLDLSQYSGARLKRNLRVLDFSDRFLLLKRTRSKKGESAITREPAMTGDTARRLIDIFRRGPKFELSLLTSLSISGIESSNPDDYPNVKKQ